MKKILVGFSAIGVALIGASMFAAFEAHVVNVTATIENALSVPVTPITFGTVFPQEELKKFLGISLSQSFIDERRVDDVEYIIRQKPKCGVTSDNGTVLVGPTWTGHVVVVGGDTQGYTSYVDCELDRPATVTSTPNDLDFYLLPSLCEYISKHPDGVSTSSITSINDGSLNSFHQPYTISATGTIVWNDTLGYLAKSENDTTDNWTIDLAVPCFGGFCGQDWEAFVQGVNPNALPASQWAQPIGNEHKVFGCNLWVEVTGVSEATSTPNVE